MKYFEKLKTTVNGHELKIVEFPHALGFHLSKKESDNRYHNVDGRDTLEECKELALKMYGAPIDSWHSEGRYIESLIAKHKRGYTLRIAEGMGEGFYLYVFDKDGRTIDEDLNGYSDLQDTIQDCKEVVLEVYGVPLDAWQEEEK